MGVKLLTIKDFSGGLCTSVEEATLPPNMSASMQNVDILDSKSVKRRNGYSILTASSLNGTHGVRAIYRYYKADGTKQWVCVSGTALVALGVVGSAARAEAESCYVAASSVNWAVDNQSWMSAGSAIRTTTNGAQAKLSLPSCDRFAFYWSYDAAPTITASYKVDGGSWVSVTGTRQLVSVSGLAATAHTLYFKNHGMGGASVWVDYADWANGVTTTHKDSTVSATATDFGFLTYNDKVYYGSAYDQYRSYNGSVTATVSASGTIKGGFAMTLKNRAYVAGPSNDTALLSYSGLDRPEAWNTTDYGSAHLPGKDSGQYCTGLKHFKNKAFWFSPSSIYCLDPTGNLTDWVNIALGENVGCVAPKSLVNVPNGLVFLSGGGVRMYGVGGEFTEEPGFSLLSDNITPSLTAYTDAQRKAACGAYYKNRYWLAIGSEVYVYRFPESGLPGSWTLYRYSGVSITCMCVTRADEEGLYAGTSDGRIVQLDVGLNDGGNDIADYYVTPPLAPGGFETIKHFRPAVDIGVNAQTTQSMTVTPYTDDVSGTAQTVTVTPNTAVQTIRAALSARGRALKLKFSGSGAGQPRTLTSVAVRYLPPRIR